MIECSCCSMMTAKDHRREPSYRRSLHHSCIESCLIIQNPVLLYQTPGFPTTPALVRGSGTKNLRPEVDVNDAETFQRTGKHFKYRNDKDSRPPDYRAPTWSWASVDGVIQTDSAKFCDATSGIEMVGYYVTALNRNFQDRNHTGELASASLTIRGRRRPAFGRAEPTGTYLTRQSNLQYYTIRSRADTSIRGTKKDHEYYIKRNERFNWKPLTSESIPNNHVALRVFGRERRERRTNATPNWL